MKVFRKGNSQREFHQSFRSQSAMEYLMTYGWAILIIAVVLAALFELGVFNPLTFAPKAPPGSCQVVRPEGPGTTNFISLEGECQGELPQYVAQFQTAPAYILIAKDAYMPAERSDSRTVTAWINPTTIPHGISPDIWGGTIFTEPISGGPNLDVCGAFNLVINNWNNPFLHKCINDVDWSSIPMRENTWEFVAVVYDNSTDTQTFYLDRQNSTISNNGMNQATINFTIGGWDDYAPTMTGYISNVQVYNTALSANDVRSLYQEGIGGAPIALQNLVGWWPLNGNANDYSGNNNYGVPTNVIYTSNWYSGYSTP